MARAITTQLTELEIRDIAERLEVGRPILAYRVVGSRVELHLLGGARAVYEDYGTSEEEKTLDRFLELVGQMTAKQLKKAAAVAGITGYSAMKKRDLIAGLSQAAMKDPKGTLSAMESVL